MDINKAILNDVLNDAVYVRPPPGFEELVPKGKNLELFKALYGLKQTPRVWNQLLDSFLRNETGMISSEANMRLYTRTENGNLELSILVYVNDIIIMARDTHKLKMAKRVFNDLGVVKWFLGMNIYHKELYIQVTQTTYTEKVLGNFNMSDTKTKVVPLSKNTDFRKLIFPDENDAKKDCPYRELIGCLLYLSVCTRPDIDFAALEMSRFVSEPHGSHWKSVKGILKYLKVTKHVGLFYQKCVEKVQGIINLLFTYITIKLLPSVVRINT